MTGTSTESWSFAYDGDGVRVSTAHFTGTNGSPDSTTSYYMGGQFEVKDGATKKYYSIAGMMVAMNDGTGLQYLLTDHLGSTVAVTNQSGTLTSQQRYLPFGAPRTIPNSPILGTDFTYTGQRKLDDGMGGVMDYKARFYSVGLGRFQQPDSIVPNPVSPQSWNRYSYVGNNPIRYNDPTGHCFGPVVVICGEIIVGIAVLAVLEMTIYHTINSPQGEQLRNQAASGLLNLIDSTSQRYDERVKQNLYDFEQMVSDMSRGSIYLRNKCSDNLLLCVGSILAALGVLASLPAKGGCDEDESLSRCPTTPAKPGTLITPSATEECPPLSNCGASSTSTPIMPILPGSELDIPTLILPPTAPPIQISPPPPNIHRLHIPI